MTHKVFEKATDNFEDVRVWYKLYEGVIVAERIEGAPVRGCFEKLIAEAADMRDSRLDIVSQSHQAATTSEADEVPETYYSSIE